MNVSLATQSVDSPAFGTFGASPVTPAQQISNTGAPDPAQVGGRWGVIVCCGNREVTLADKLAAERLPFYLPMQEIRQADAAGKKRWVRRPLFRGFLFIVTAQGEVPDFVRRSPWFRGRIEVRESAQRQLASELHNFWIAENEHVRLEPWRGLDIGGRYRVLAGPFEGIEGRVERIGSNHRIELRVSEIGSSYSLEVEPENLELA